MQRRDGGDIAEQAAAWLARHDAGLSADEQAAFDRWLDADPNHRRAWDEVQAAWQALEVPLQEGAAEGMIRELSARQRRRRVRWTTAVAAGTMAAAAAWVVLVQPIIRGGPTMSAETATLATLVRAQPERRTLEDGSVVELKTGAEIDVDFSIERRSVRLHGVAHFTVMKDAARPFVVVAESAEVRAVGTAFTVRAEESVTMVLVTEGTIAVNRAAGAHEPALVHAGHRIAVSGDANAGQPLKIEPVTEAELARLQGWRAPRLILDGTPLAEVVAAMNQENLLQLSVGEAALGRMKLNGVLRADDAAGFVRLLETYYGVQAEPAGTNRVVLRTQE